MKFVTATVAVLLLAGCGSDNTEAPPDVEASVTWECADGRTFERTDTAYRFADGEWIDATPEEAEAILWDECL